jgi:hypothetical protein
VQPDKKVSSQIVHEPLPAWRLRLDKLLVAGGGPSQSQVFAPANFSALTSRTATEPAWRSALDGLTVAGAPSQVFPGPLSPAVPAECDSKDFYGEPMVWNPAKLKCERVLKKLPANYRPPPPPVLRTKRGLGTTNIRALASMFPGLSWYYNWNPTPLMNDQRLVPFVAMKAQHLWPSFDMLDVSSDAHALLYNEPNHKEQANLTPQAAAAQWAAAEDFLAHHPKVRLGSPCPANDGHRHMLGGDPWKWMDEYIRLLPPGAWDKIAFVTIHPYGNFGQLKSMVEMTWKKYKKPIWITEFAAVGGLAAQTQLMREALPYLDSNPHVERYAWFPAGGFAWMSGGETNPNILTTVEGDLTPLGRMYMAGSPQTSVEAARARAAVDFAAQQATKAAKEEAAKAAKLNGLVGGVPVGGVPVVPVGGVGNIPVKPSTTIPERDDDDDVDERQPTKTDIPAVTRTNPPPPGKISIVPLKKRAKPAVFLAPTLFSPDDIRTLVDQPQAWAKLAGQLAGMWLNTTPDKIESGKYDTNRKPIKINRPIDQYKGLYEELAKLLPNLFAVQNIQAGLLGDMTKTRHAFYASKDSPKVFKDEEITPTWTTKEHDDWGMCKKGTKYELTAKQITAGQKCDKGTRTENDGEGRQRGVEAQPNAMLVLKRLSNGGADVNVVAVSVVTDYICKHKCFDGEDWRPEDVLLARAYWDKIITWKADSKGKGAAFDLTFTTTGVKAPMFISARHNWFPDKTRPPRPVANDTAWQERENWDPVLLETLETGDGVVFELAPISFFPKGLKWDPNVDKQMINARAIDRFAVCRKWTRANNKLMVWLAPAGDATAGDATDNKTYLATMQRAVREFQRRGIMPDAIVVNKYGGGSNDNPVPTFPEIGANGQPANSALGVARWLIDNA